MKKTVFLWFLFNSFFAFNQSNLKKFFNLSSPKKTWVLCHIFKAKKALEISTEAQKITDSIAKTNLLDKDISGGQVDAFRHAYWMARLHQEIGERAARSLGKAHEKENYKTYKKRKLEDGILPDKIASEMDLYNNEVGIHLISKGSKISKKALLFRVVNSIKEGKMKIIKKDKNGLFLTCDGKSIPKNELKAKWENNKCLVVSRLE